MPYAKRTSMPGFPKDFVFQTREQVDHYLGGDRITCLMCGRDFKGLEPHLYAVHEMSPDEYREKYGLPYRRGLICESLSKRKSENNRKMFQENPERQMAALSKAKAVQAEFGNPQRKKPKFWKNERTIYEHNHYEEFLRRVLAGRQVSHVSLDDDVPTSTSVYLYLESNKEFAEKYRTLVPLFAPVGGRARSVE